MSQIVPISSDPASRIEIELNSVRLFFSFIYSWNGNKWSFNLEDSNGLLINGVTMMLGKNLFESHPDLENLIGLLWMVDLSGQNLDANEDDLGDRVIMIHYPPGETPIIPEVE